MEGYFEFKADLRRSLENLAADAAGQTRYLKDLGDHVNPDELALEFDNVSRNVGRAVKENLVSANTASAIEALNRGIQAMSGDASAHLWSIGGLHAPEWDVIRRHARAALDSYEADLIARRGEPGEDLPPARDLTELASAVDSKASFLAFVAALWDDREDEERKERIHPSNPYGPGANGWENGSIENFLDAAAAWGDATSAIDGKPMLPEVPTWRAFAFFLLAGKVYE